MDTWETCSPVPSTHTGGSARSATRSSATSTTAAPPSERMQQCSLVKGSAIIGPDSTSSTVIGSRNNASWFGRRWRGPGPRPRPTVPASCRIRACGDGRPWRTWRSACARTGPRTAAGRGSRSRGSRCGACAEVGAGGGAVRSSTTSAWPAAMASAACAAMTSQVAPPTEVESTHVGAGPGTRRPRPVRGCRARPRRNRRRRPASARRRPAQHDSPGRRARRVSPARSHPARPRRSPPAAPSHRRRETDEPGPVPAAWEAVTGIDRNGQLSFRSMSHLASSSVCDRRVAGGDGRGRHRLVAF